MDEQPRKKPSRLANVFWVFGSMGVLLLIGAMLLLSTATVGGSATTPGGASVDIQSRWGVSVAATKPNQTTIDIDGYKLVFTPTALTVNGFNIAGFNASAKRHTLVSDRRGLRLLTNGRELLLR